MNVKIKILTRSAGEVLAEIDEARNPKTVRAVLAALPIESTVNRWGEEVYFSTQVRAGEERAQEEVEVGEIGFWPPGSALCIFFGRTPASTGSKPRAASPVNVIGKVLGDPKVFGKTRGGESISVGRA